MTLNRVAVGDRKRIIRCQADESLRHRTEALGLVPGEMVRVISENDGALIVEVKNSRLALGHDMAGCLTVM